jgi:hypothetical protein
MRHNIQLINYLPNYTSWVKLHHENLKKKQNALNMKMNPCLFYLYNVSLNELMVNLVALKELINITHTICLFFEAFVH